MERFDKWLAKIAARDYFHAPGGTAAREAVERCRTALAAFEAAALAAQAGTHPAWPPRARTQALPRRVGARGGHGGPGEVWTTNQARVCDPGLRCGAGDENRTRAPSLEITGC
ncbi:hypothetical protein [Streptomyces sp. NBRC 110028]|uniref:hypothetical protein n=1 Tax=Streptomyces sp. NBRC 110028 TaxID=1621260 RepID=UPI00351BFF1A